VLLLLYLPLLQTLTSCRLTWQGWAWRRQFQVPYIDIVFLLHLPFIAASDLDQLQADLAGLGMEPATPISATSGEGMADLYQLLQPLVDGAAQQQQQQQQQQQHGSGPSSSSSSSRGRQLVPGDFRFSGQGLMQHQDHQQQQQQEDELASDAAVARDAAQAEQQEAAEQAAAAAAAAAEKAEVDRLVQQQQQLAAATGTDSDAADDDAGFRSAIPTTSSIRSSSSSSSSSDVHEAAEEDGEEDAAAAAEGGAVVPPLRMAILGLPNAGKSTLMNTLLGYERSLTGEQRARLRGPGCAAAL
jgi:predicted GTPase